MFNRVLIANRGEVALRIIKACRALNVETVAVYSEADADSPHLAEADRVVCIGPGQSGQSYLNREALLQAALNCDVQALHPGFGFLAEDHLFAYSCTQQKLSFIGPSSESIRLMGDKSLAKSTVKVAGLPTIPGSEGNLSSLPEALDLAQSIGYPVLLKATAGGGGKGIRICRDRKDLEALYPQARLEAEKAFGNPMLYLEKLIAPARHIEFQILADSYGRAVHLGERECSIQRKNQKLIEESPSPAISPEVRLTMGERVCRAAETMGYQNAGTVEFLLGEDGQLYFMEMNTRLQVEHPVTEMVSGRDIVQEQIRIAANHPLSFTQDEVRFTGHAIECRIKAEDPDKDFIPTPGEITRFEPVTDQGPGRVRLDTHVRKGYHIPVYYDSMICKIISHGEDRESAIETMVRALEKFRVEGIKTTIPLHLEILKSSPFRKGEYDTATLGTLR